LKVKAFAARNEISRVMQRGIERRAYGVQTLDIFDMGFDRKADSFGRLSGASSPAWTRG
jgi:hypothetical protein